MSTAEFLSYLASHTATRELAADLERVNRVGVEPGSTRSAASFGFAR